MSCAKGRSVPSPAASSRVSLSLSWGTRTQQQVLTEHSGKVASAFSYLPTCQVAWPCFALSELGNSLLKMKGRNMKNVHKINLGQLQPEDGGKGGRFIHFHDNSHREKKQSPASPQGPELNSQGCQSDQEFNSIYSVGRLSGASTSASGCCPQPTQAEQPGVMNLPGLPCNESFWTHKETVSLSFMAT